MTREEAREILTHNWTRVDNPNYSESELDEAFFMAIEALQREEAEEKGYCHRIKPKEYFENDATNRAEQKLREMPRYLNGVKEKQITKISAKLNNPCNSLLTDESNGSKEHKSKLDLISRQDVIEALCRSSVYAWSIEQDQAAHDWALNIIKALPSADAVHGEWEHWGSPFSDESEVIDTIVCSVCGARFIEPKDEPKGEYNFCPSCGADMRGDKYEIDRCRRFNSDNEIHHDR